MLMERIGPGHGKGEPLVVRLMRRWAAARDEGRNRTVSVVRLASDLGQSPMLAVALDSLLQLTEACLGRPLIVERCCNPRMSRDERAVLLMIRLGGSSGEGTRAEIPHGLPGALSWAIASFRSLLPHALGASAHPLPASCPFGPPSARVRGGPATSSRPSPQHPSCFPTPVPWRHRSTANGRG